MLTVSIEIITRHLLGVTLTSYQLSNSTLKIINGDIKLLYKVFFLLIFVWSETSFNRMYICKVLKQELTSSFKIKFSHSNFNLSSLNDVPRQDGQFRFFNVSLIALFSNCILSFSAWRMVLSVRWLCV